MNADGAARTRRGGWWSFAAIVLGVAALLLAAWSVTVLNVGLGVIMSEVAPFAIFQAAPATVLLAFAALPAALIGLARGGSGRSLVALGVAVLAVLSAIVAAFTAFAMLLTVT